MPSRRCSLGLQPFAPVPGEWHFGERTYEPSSCALVNVKDLRACFRGRTVTIIGDSTGLHLSLAMASFLGGTSTPAAEDNNVRVTGAPCAASWLNRSQPHRSAPACCASRPGDAGAGWWGDVHPGRAGAMSGLLTSQTDLRSPCIQNDKTLDRCGSHTIIETNTTVRFCRWQDVRNWPQIHSEIRGRARHDDLVFILFGAHFLKYYTKQAYPWLVESTNFIKSPVFSPYISHWCWATSVGRESTPP
eukprot:7375892-Prymnesium_polylepis.1